MTSLRDYEKNRQVFFDTMYSFEGSFTPTELEKKFRQRLRGDFYEIDRRLTIREVIRDLEIYGLLEKEGARYKVLVVDLSR